MSKHNLHIRRKIDLLRFWHPRDSVEEHLTGLLTTNRPLDPIYIPKDRERQIKLIILTSSNVIKNQEW